MLVRGANDREGWYVSVDVAIHRIGRYYMTYEHLPVTLHDSISSRKCDIYRLLLSCLSCVVHLHDNGLVAMHVNPHTVVVNNDVCIIIIVIIFVECREAVVAVLQLDI